MFHICIIDVRVEEHSLQKPWWKTSKENSLLVMGMEQNCHIYEYCWPQLQSKAHSPFKRMPTYATHDLCGSFDTSTETKLTCTHTRTFRQPHNQWKWRAIEQESWRTGRRISCLEYLNNNILYTILISVLTDRSKPRHNQNLKEKVMTSLRGY